MAKSESKTSVVYREIWSRFAKPFTRLFIIAIFLMTIVAASSAIYPAIMQQVFNHLAGEETFIKHNFITIVPIIIILTALIKASAMYLQIITVNRFAQSIATSMQDKMMNHLLHADLGVITQHPSGVFISRIMNDVNLVKEAVVRLSNNLIRDFSYIADLINLDCGTIFIDQVCDGTLIEQYEFLNFIENHNFKKQIFGSTLILYDKNVKIDLNRDLNQIDIFQLKKNAKIVFLGGYLEDLKINFNGVNLKNLPKKLKLNPIDINGLTGCLSFINIKISNIKLAAKNSSCEDSINLVNTAGQINEILIENSLSDGLDIDFSELKIGFIDIKNSKNDCADFSFGNYEINKLLLNNCGDKGASVGEKSLFQSDKIIVKNSNIGIASKDSSEVYLKDITIDKVETCLSAYNKKQEFLGGFIKATNLDCQKFKNFTNKDEMSEIIINKKISQSNLKRQNFFN